MRILLDTDTCISIIRDKTPGVRQKFEAVSVGDIGVSTITVAELCFGAEKSQRPEQNMEALAQFLLPLRVVEFSYGAAGVYGRVRAYLAGQGTPIGPLDTFIAAHALHLDLSVVTNNVREFSWVPGLRVENWME